MKFKKSLLTAVSLLALSAAAPASAGEPHVDIRLVFGLPGIYVERPPVVVYPAPRPPVVVVRDYPHYYPRIAHYDGHRHYEARRFKEVEHRHQRDRREQRQRDGGRSERGHR